jgi:molybdopterin synthase catalytic subunit
VSHSALRLVDLRETPLDVSEVVAALDDDASGA